MSRIIKTWRDPYDAGFSTCRKKQIEIQQGLTVLVGCNGSGKTTLLHNIKSELKKEDIPVFYYDNEKDGGNNSISESIFYGNLSFTATALCSSEGENISLNLSKIASKLRKFVETGDNGDRFNALAKTLALKDDNEENNVSNERWILLDAMDSGYSIDNVIEMKDFFDLVIKNAKEFGIELYIMISSNEYELAHESKCFDVMEGKYIQFASYEDYKKFILRTREKKDKRKYR
jgi:predicted ATP-dependent endonuclease of OLD family|nr:MAG TPA_asm: RNA dependent RNA polymerase [Caudoviricetes sp.]